MSILNKIWKNRWLFRSLVSTLWFNFHYLPFKQAIRLPILLYKPHFVHSKGRVRISGPVKFGMIKLGCFEVSVYPNNGITLELYGDVEFKGRCNIGNNSYVTVGPQGHLVFGEYFRATTSLKLIAFHHVVFHDRVLIGWNTIIMDTNFHRLKRVDGKPTNRGYGSVIVGANTWICNNVEITPGTTIPHHSVIQAHALVTKRMEQESYALYGGNPAKLIAKGYYYDFVDDVIDYRL